jgi:hypothetical protein
VKGRFPCCSANDHDFVGEVVSLLRLLRAPQRVPRLRQVQLQARPGDFRNAAKAAVIAPAA